MLVRAAVAGQLAFVATIALTASACGAHAGGAAHGSGRPPAAVERSCVAAESGRPVPLHVTAVDEGGRPVARASVSISDAGAASGVGALLQTDERGEAEADVLAGLWRIEVSFTGRSTERYLLDLRPGQSCSVRFRLEPAPNEFEF